MLYEFVVKLPMSLSKKEAEKRLPDAEAYAASITQNAPKGLYLRQRTDEWEAVALVEADLTPPPPTRSAQGALTHVVREAPVNAEPHLLR